MCQDLAAKRALPTEHFVEEIIPNLFSLAWDAVPNVRLALARCLALTLFPLGKCLFVIIFPLWNQLICLSFCNIFKW